MASSNWNRTSSSGLVVAQGHEISVTVESFAEAKLAIKELQHLKKDIQLEKRRVNGELKAIRTERSQQLAHQGSMIRGGGSWGQIVRSLQRSSRDSARAKHANRMAPYQSEITRLDDQIRQVDELISGLEGYLLEIEAAAELDRQAQQAIPVEAFPVCPSCGNAEAPGARFCGECGART